MPSVAEHYDKAEEWAKAMNAPNATTAQVRACAAAVRAELNMARYIITSR